MKRQSSFLLIVLMLVSLHLAADDGAASIAAGGIVVMKREPRIVMAKEVLRISDSKVIVDYDFRNDSDEDITTEIAFPIPDYEFDLNQGGPNQGFDDFNLRVNGKAVRYHTEARAFLKDKEYTDLLRSMRVDIATFGHLGPRDMKGRDIQRLDTAQRGKLIKLELIGSDGDALWKVTKKYHWQQTFPARKIVHIRHEYTPNFGSLNSIRYGMEGGDNEAAKELETFCLEEPLKTTLKKIADSNDRDAPYVYVDFILTSANTWKTPIEDFTLIVERPHSKDWKTQKDLGTYVSFCWDGPVKKIDADHFSAHVENLVPTKELRVGFFTVESARY